VILNHICIHVLANKNISFLINKKSYKYVENKIAEFKLYIDENDVHSIEISFDKWITSSKSKHLLSHKEIFLKRVSDKNYREIATDQYYKDDQTNTSH
jgi:hypothetical protein